MGQRCHHAHDGTVVCRTRVRRTADEEAVQRPAGRAAISGLAHANDGCIVSGMLREYYKIDPILAYHKLSACALSVCWREASKICTRAHLPDGRGLSSDGGSAL